MGRRQGFSLIPKSPARGTKSMSSSTACCIRLAPDPIAQLHSAGLQSPLLGGLKLYARLMSFSSELSCTMLGASLTCEPHARLHTIMTLIATSEL